MIQSNRVGLNSAVGLIKTQTYSLRSHLLRKWHPSPVNGLPVAAHLIGRTVTHCGVCHSTHSSISNSAMPYREQLVAACRAVKLAAELCTVR